MATLEATNVMLTFAAIPTDNLNELVAIEIDSNPYPWSEKNLIDCYQDYQHLGAFLNGQLIAFVIYRLIADEGEIIHIVCDKKQQGNGYAHQLFSELTQQSKTQHHTETWHLEVRASNHKAIQLYQRLGFTEVGRRKGYYQDKEDAILMSYKQL